MSIRADLSGELSSFCCYTLGALVTIIQAVVLLFYLTFAEIQLHHVDVPPTRPLVSMRLDRYPQKTLALQDVSLR
jgi:hypothetical protein